MYDDMCFVYKSPYAQRVGTCTVHTSCRRTVCTRMYSAYTPIVLVQLCDDANKLRKSSAIQIREYTHLIMSNLIFWFAIVICASTLNGSSVCKKDTSQQFVQRDGCVSRGSTDTVLGTYHSSSSLLPPVQQLKQASHTISSSRLIILLSRGWPL